MELGGRSPPFSPRRGDAPPFLITTPVEFYHQYNLWVKREDLCCPGGPNLEKIRGAYSHIRARNEGTIAVLDTTHSSNGWVVARACKELGRRCELYYPVRKAEIGQPLRRQQSEAAKLGAILHPLPAGRSTIMYYQLRKALGTDTYLMPNAMKIIESTEEIAVEAHHTKLPPVNICIIPVGTGTIASGVIRGLAGSTIQRIILYLGYSRPTAEVLAYINKMSGVYADIEIIDEGYSYKDVARDGETPSWPCNPWYELKAFRWWMKEERKAALFWNAGE